MILVLAVVGVTFVWFIRALRTSVYNTQLTNMDELASHDIVTIENYLEDDWKSLQNITSKIALENVTRDEDISNLLRKEQVQSEFEDIYLIDDQYFTYTTAGKDTANQELLQKYYIGHERVMSTRDLMGMEDRADERYIYSGKRIRGVTLNGKNIIGIVGKLDLNKIQKRIRISNYKGKGYSSVFDQDGNMIIGVNAGGQRLTNYYTFLSNSTDLTEEEVKTIKLKAEGEESFQVTFTEKYSKEVYVVSFQSIPEMDWNFIMSVPKSVFDKQNQNMILLTVTMLSIILVGVVTMLLLLLRYQVRNSKAKEKEKQRVALEAALQQAEVASKAKSAFLFSMSHDIRTPMNAVIGLSDLAKNHKDEPEKMDFYLEQIGVAGKQLLSIINNILEVSRIESNKVRVDEELVDSVEVLEGIKTVFLNQQQASQLKINFTSDVRHRYLYMDRTHVEEVLINLISNALKYTPAGGEVTIDFQELPGEKEGEVIIQSTVQDNGIGMSEEYQKKLFQEFERERTSTVSGIQGTGLGLSIVKRLIDLMKGTIEVKSQKDKGTTMVVRLPHRIGEEPKEEEEVKASDDSLFAGKRVLLAEDIDINAMIAEELLTSRGLKVERAKNGLEAVEMMKAAAVDYYDMVLMDIQMPEMDGYQATMEIRNLDDSVKSRIPILAMTANAFREDREKSLEAGMNGHVAKPIDVDKLFAALMRALVLQKYHMDHSELSDFKEKYSSLGCKCGYFIYRDDEKEQIIYADPRVAEIFGCETEDEFMKYADQSFRGLVHPSDLIAVEQKIMEQQESSERHIDNITYRIIRKDGVVRKVRDIAYRAFNGEENLYYVYIADVTDVE